MATKGLSLALNPELQALLDLYRAKRGFLAKEWIEKKCTMFNKYMSDCGLKAACISLSGGVDSAVTLGLVKFASEMEGSPISKILAISQPIHSSDWAKDRAMACAAKFGVECIVIDQSKIHDDIIATVSSATGIKGGAFADGQLRSYQRTPTAYYVAQLLSQEGTPCIVMGTGNMDEDMYLAYFCKAGDGVVDVQLIADLHKSEVFAVGKELGVIDSILASPPSADLWSGQTDEEELGFSYDFVELWTGYVLPNKGTEMDRIREALSEEAKSQLDQWGAMASKVHKRNKHKLTSPVNLNVLETPKI